MVTWLIITMMNLMKLSVCARGLTSHNFFWTCSGGCPTTDPGCGTNICILTNINICPSECKNGLTSMKKKQDLSCVREFPSYSLYCGSQDRNNKLYHDFLCLAREMDVMWEKKLSSYMRRSLDLNVLLCVFIKCAWEESISARHLLTFTCGASLFLHRF